MNNLPRSTRSLAACSALLIGLSVFAPPRLLANVYATSIRMNGLSQDVSTPQGIPVSISYVLNEPASAGVQIQVLSGSNVLRTITVAAAQPGTARGWNTVAWDGKDDNGSLVPVGNYSISIRAASAGFAQWTAISDDAGATNYVYRGTGIAVNRNPTSPYYGQVYVASSENGPNAGIPGAKPGENNGLLRFNADGSEPEDGVLVTDPSWSGFGLSPWRIETTDDDFVYVSDLAVAGETFRWNADLSTESKLQVLSSSNFPDPNDTLYGPAIFGPGTNRSVWVGDSSPITPKGILKYVVTDDGTIASTNTGTVVVGITNDISGMDQYPYDVALDKTGNIYAIQYRAASGDFSPRVLRFPAYDPSTNSDLPEVVADWAVGSLDDTMGRASGVAVDPTGTYLAVAFKGVDGPLLDWINGCTQVFYASNGAFVANLDLGVAVNGETSHQDTDCAWDAVGNLYFIDDFLQLWRVYSPPGPSQSTTVALQQIQVTPGGGGGEAPVIQTISYANGSVTIRFTATAGTAVSNLQLLGAAQASGPYAVIAGAVITPGVNPGEYVATVTATSPALFYRIQLSGGNPQPGGSPTITSILKQGDSVTILFVGATADTPAAFALQSSASLQQSFATAPGATITAGGSPGEFRATITASGPIQFYRIQRL
jgi:hypothetical protein